MTDAVSKRLLALARLICDTPILLLCIGYIVVNILAVESELRNPTFAIACLLCLLVVCLALLLMKRPRFILFPLLGSLLAAFVVVRWFHNEAAVRAAVRERYMGKDVEIEGYISREPELDHESVSYVMRVLNITDRETDEAKDFRSIKLNLLIEGERYPVYSLGQRCRFSGKLVEPESFSDFDYRKYLRYKKIFYIARSSSVIQCENIENVRSGSRLRNSLYDIKLMVVNRVERKIPEPQASLLIGILLGEDRVFDEVFAERLRVTGTTHIIAASGYNVAILIASVHKLTASWLPKRARIALSLLAVWLFVILSGGSASIVRAAIMSTLALLALSQGRKGVVHLLLPLSALIFSLFDPKIFYNLSFQLSVAATAGLIYITPILEEGAGKVKLIGKRFHAMLGAYLFPTLACTLSTIPITAYYFGQLSIAGVVSNFLILPVVEGSLLLGVVSILGDMISQNISGFTFLALYLELKYFQLVVDWIGQYEHVLVSLDGFGLYHAAAIFILELLLVVSLYPKSGVEKSYYYKQHGYS
ncbi:MAG: ComEC/Rec2 family competence protein [Candidatus Dojkabacteria bacterium]|nr:MAG: ComEC/Rec2 family competence protein [Candidatus Dojkabacteria bacterium]